MVIAWSWASPLLLTVGCFGLLIVSVNVVDDLRTSSLR